MCALFTRKVDFMVDELLTYNLSNAESWFNPTNDVVYTPAGSPFIQAMVSNGKFDLAHVWKQQTNDTHPPFYYVLVHAICTLFPGKFNVMFAGVINIIFAVLTLFVFRKLVKILVEDDFFIFTISLAFCFSAGVLEGIPLLRMYVMSMFFVTLIAYFVVKNIEFFGWKQYLTLALITICGALTHYYFLVYMFFISTVVNIIMIIQRRYKEVLCYLITCAISGGW